MDNKNQEINQTKTSKLKMIWNYFLYTTIPITCVLIPISILFFFFMYISLNLLDVRKEWILPVCLGSLMGFNSAIGINLAKMIISKFKKWIKSE